MATSTIGSGARDYATLNAWWASLPSTLTEAEVAEMYNDSEFTSSSSQSLSGVTTSGTNTVTVTTGSGQSFVDHANLETNALRYNVSNGVGLVGTGNYTAGATLIVSVNNCQIEKIQFKNLGSGTGGWALECNAATTTNFNRCIIEHTNASGCRLRGPAIMRNTLVIGRTSGVSKILTTILGPGLYNVTAVVPGDLTPATNAVSSGYGSGTIKNCAFFGVSGINSGSTSWTYITNMTNVSSPPSGWTTATYANQFENVNNSAADFRLKSGADCIDAGTNEATHSATSINGVSRPSGSYDVGAWEFVSGGGGPAAGLRTLSLTGAGV